MRFKRLVALLALEPLADLLPGAGRPDDIQPVAARAFGGLAGQDLDDVAVAQLVVERDHAIVDFGAHAAVADVGVDAVGEVHRRGLRRQGFDLALGGEDEDLVLKEVELD